MSPDLRRYLTALKEYCSTVTVLGQGLYPPDRTVSLDHVYVEPEAQAERDYWATERLEWDDRRTPEAEAPPHRPPPPPPEPILSIVAKGPRLFLMGDPGLGKTTTLRCLAAQAACERLQGGAGPLPIFVELHRWEPGETLAGRLRSAVPEPVQAQTNEAAWAEIADELEAGQCWLLLDGLDEYRGEAEKDVLTPLAQAAEGTEVPFLISSRPTQRPVGGPWSDVPVYYLRELRPEDVQRLCGLICPEEPAKTRLSRFAKGSGAALCRIPLFLVMMSRLADDPGTDEMPRTRTRAFGRFLDSLERWEEKKTGARPPLTAAHLRAALGPLALRLRLRERDDLQRADVEQALENEVRDKAPEALAYLARLQILRQVRGRYEFAYEVLLDYFAACGLAASEALIGDNQKCRPTTIRIAAWETAK